MLRHYSTHGMTLGGEDFGGTMRIQGWGLANKISVLVIESGESLCPLSAPRLVKTQPEVHAAGSLRHGSGLPPEPDRAGG